MKLWILRPIDGDKLWEPWYDKAFGFVVRAKTEEEARKLAQSCGGDEIGWNDDFPAWTSSKHSTCEELNASGDAGVIIRDYSSA